MKLKKSSLFMGCLLNGTTLFAQATSLPLDNQVLMGRLDNGITYMIRHNASPRHQACFYLVNGIGALAEKPSQHGMAHYLEHMMFQGTKHFPKRSMIDMLERHGILYGTDINARTSENETVYNLSNVPTTDQRVLDSCLMVMADWSYALDLHDDRIEHERGPILRELAMRNTPQNRISTIWANTLLKGTAYENHDVLGTLDDIKSITPNGLRAFYESWHNPAQLNVVVVGDFDVRQMEARLKAILSRVPMGDMAQQRPFFAIPERDSLTYCLATDKDENSERVMLVKLQPDTPESKKSSKDYLVMQVMVQLINDMGATRMSQISSEDGSPFQGSAISVIPLKRGYFTYQIGASMKQTGEEMRGVRMLLLEYERLKQVGFTHDEFQRAKDRMLVSNRQAEGSQMSHDKIAKMLEQYYLQGEPIVDYDKWHAFERSVLDTLSLSSVNSLIRSWSNDRNLSVVITGSEGISYPNKQDILDVFEQVKKVNYKNYSFILKPEMPLADLMLSIPKPGRITKEKVYKAKGITTWKLSNGATVIYKQIPNDRKQVCLRAVRPGGQSMFSIKELPSAQVATMFVEAGGIGGLSPQQLNRLQEAKGFKCDSKIYEYSEQMEGVALPGSVEQMLRLMYLRFTHPIIDTALIKGSISQNKELAQHPRLNAQMRMQDSVAILRGGGHPRILCKHGNYFNNITPASITEVWNRCFGSANGFTFVITGAMPAEQYRWLVEQYIASLPGKGKPTRWIDNKMYGYQGFTERTVHTGAMGSYAYDVLGISAAMPYTPLNELHNRIVARIFQQRAMNMLREKNGDVYAVNVSQTVQAIPRGAFEVSLEFQADTLRAANLLDKVYGIWEELAHHGVTADETEMALAYFTKVYILNDDKADKWADSIAQQVANNTLLLDADNYAETAHKVTTASINAYLRLMDNKKNVVKIIFR